VSRDILDRLLATRAEIARQLALLRAKVLGTDPDLDPPPKLFSPAAGMRPSAPPAEPLDVRGRAA
jgi:hypothetical protein